MTGLCPIKFDRVILLQKKKKKIDRTYHFFFSNLTAKCLQIERVPFE